MKSSKVSGFTIIEVLVSMALFGVLVAAILAPMANTFKMTSTSKSNLQATSDNQKLLEKARQIVIANYNDGAKIASLLASDVTLKDIKCENVNLYNEPMPNLPADCSGAGLDGPPVIPAPPVRRLTLQKTSAGSPTPNDIKFVVSVPKP